MAIASAPIANSRGLSMGFRIFAAITGGACLAQEAWTNIQASGFSWSNPNPVVLGAALLSFVAASAWPFAEKAFRERAWVNMACLMAGFFFATAACLVNGVTVQSKDVDTRSGIAAGSQVAYAAANVAKSAAEADVTRLVPLRDKECTVRGSQCQKQETALAEAKAQVERQTGLIQTAINGMEQIGPEHSIAELLGLPTSDERVSMWRPVLQPIALCLFGIGFLGMALRDGIPAARPATATANPGPVLVVNNDVEDHDPVFEALRKAGRSVSNEELADLLGVSIGQSSKMVTARLGPITRTRDGKRVAIKIAQ